MQRSAVLLAEYSRLKNSNPPFLLVKIINMINHNDFIHRVEGAIRYGLDSPAEESEEENDEAHDGYEATLLSQSEWLDADFVELHGPPLTLKQIHQYFITGRLQKEQVTATKPFERGYS